MKKVLYGVLGFFALVLVAILVIPFVVNVDQYRPQVVQLVNEKIHGKFDLGKLSLTLWGQVRIGVEGVQLEDTQHRKIISVKDAYFHVPWSSVFQGAPEFVLKVTQPELEVTKDKVTQKLNVLTLMKETAPAAPAPGASAAAPSPTKAPAAPATMNLPKAVLAARLGLEFEKAVLRYSDEITGEKTQVKDLNVAIRDISLSRPTQMKVWAVLDAPVSGMGSAKGPIEFQAKFDPKFDQAQLLSFKLNGAFDADQLEVDLPGLFIKKAGIPANVKFDLSSDGKSQNIEKIALKFHNAEINVKGQVTEAATQVQVQSNEIQLAPWSELVPMLKAYDLGGSASLHASTSGPSAQLQYQGKLEVKNVTAKAPHLKAPPHIEGLIAVSTDKIDQILFKLTGPGSDLELKGQMVSFTAPKLSLVLSSNSLDLDQWIDFPKPTPAAAAKTSEPVAASAGAEKAKSAAPAVDLDKSVDPLRKNPMMAAFAATFDVNMKKIKANNVVINDLVMKSSFRDLTVMLSEFKLKIFGGSIDAKGSVAMKPTQPTYSFNTNVAGFDMKQAVTSQMAMLKNTVYGIANFKMDLSGSSFNPEPATKNLKAKGHFDVKNATFTSIDIAKMTNEAAGETISKLSAKIPALKGKSVKVPNREAQYDRISADFTIANGNFSMPNFEGKASPNQGVDLRGDTNLNLIDQSIKARWEMIDTYNYTKLRDISVDQQGVKVDSIFAEGKNPVRFPVSVGCKAVQPCYSYTEVPEYLGKVALNNVGKAAGEKVKGEAKKKIESVVDQAAQKAPEPAKKAIEKFKKKFF